MTDQALPTPSLAAPGNIGLAAGQLGTLQRALLVAAGALLLCWAALVNGGPFFHPDTVSYVRGPDVAVLKVLGPRFASPWAAQNEGAAARAVSPSGGAAAAPRSYDDKEVLAGRSIYYGALAWLGEVSGGFWLTILCQALAVAYLLDALLRAVGRRSVGAYAAAAAVVAFATPAPLFVALLMPDIWAAVGLGAFALLLAFGRRLRLAESLALSGLMAFAVLAHTSNLLLVAGLIATAPLVRWIAGRRAPRVRTAVLAGAGAIAVGIAGGLAFTFAVIHLAGAKPLSPPFITARLIADGTGARYLESHCPSAGFEACRYRGQRPADADDYLWSLDPAKAVFATATAESRRALSGEQTRVALAVVAADPLGQVAASARNVVQQIGDSDLANFNYKQSVRASLDLSVPPSRLHVFRDTAAYREAWPLGPMQVWYTVVRVLAAIALLAWLVLSWKRSRTGDDAPVVALRAWTAAVVVGVLGNAAICGALSAPYGRYQARLDWLLPVTALLVFGSLAGRRDEEAARPRV